METGKDLRPLVALVFLPGLYVCLIVSAVLSILAAGLMISILYWVFSYVGRIPVGIMGLIGIGGILGVFYSIKGGWRTIQKGVVRCHAVQITYDKAPMLFKMIEDLALEMKTAMPDNIVLELGSNFFVTESKVITFDGEYKSRTLCIGAPMLHILTPTELKAIVAHELAHFTGEDTVYSKRFYPIYRGTTSALIDMANVSESGNNDTSWMSLALIIPMWILNTYLNVFARIERRIGRQRELRADLVASQVSTSNVMASALIKAHVYGALWYQVSEKWIVDGLNEGKAFLNISELFANTFIPQKDLLKEVAQDSSTHISHPTDSHPSLNERLFALGEKIVDELSAEDETAVTLFIDLNSIEQHLTDYETSMVQQFNPNVDKNKVAAV
jgi:Zn-dependent protease with chaperone function